MTIEDKVRLLVNGAHGIYAWQAFIQTEDATAWHIEPEDVVTLTNGPDDPDYWEAAANVEMGAEYTDTNGHAWHLHQDGDIYAIRDDLTDEEFREVFP